MKLSWSAYFAALTAASVSAASPGWCVFNAVAGPGAHNANVEDPRLADFDVPSSPLVRAVLGVQHPRFHRGRGLVLLTLSRILSCLLVTRFHRRLQNSPWHGSVAKDGA
jgi:hypothetical protein